MKEAMYYEKLDKSYVRCNLCPHYCVIKDGAVGTCRVRENSDGILYTLNYGKISSYGYDDIEKKPLYHFFPGSTIFSVGSYGCNLSCDFCQNYEIVYDSSHAVSIEDGELISLAGKNNSIGLAYTYNESSIWYEYILDTSKRIRAKGLKNIMVTNGYINVEPLRELLPYIDAINIDLKSMDSSFYQDICKGRIEPVLKTIEIASKYTHVEVTSLLIEGANSNLEQIEELGKKIASIDKKIPLHLNRYFPAYKMDLPPTSMDMLLKGRDILRKHLDFVYIGNVAGMDNSTYCKACGQKLIDVNMPVKITGIKNGRCINCDRDTNIRY